MGVNLIDNYIYIYHLDKFCLIPVYPETISDTMQSEFSSTNALSRSAPVFSYKYSGPRQVVISLSLHRDLMNDVNTNVSNLKDNVVDFRGEDYIDTLIRYLQACSLPKYNNYAAGSKGVIPPMVAVRFGNDIFIKGVISSTISVTKKKPILSNGKYAWCEISFNVSESDPYDADTVSADGSFRGLTRTFKDGIYVTETAGPTINTVGGLGSNNSDKVAETVIINGKQRSQKIPPLVIGKNE